jgi:hypothetical protein
LYNIGDIYFKYITISELLYWNCFKPDRKGNPLETTGLSGKPTGKRLNSLRGINANKYLEFVREINKLAMRWIG